MKQVVFAIALIAMASLMGCLNEDDSSDTCPEHAQTGFGYKGDQPCEYLKLFDGMRENGLIN